MEKNQRIKSFSQRLNVDKNIQILKNVGFVAKGITTLSKIELDSRTLQKYNLERENKEHQRSQSGLTKRKEINPSVELKSQAKGSRALLQATGPFKFQVRDIKQQKERKLSNFVSLEKSKISSKNYGIIQAYSANSHPGPISQSNEDRICIVTNLTKTTNKKEQVAFFGIYDGSSGVAKADYLRDNYHLLLIQEDNFLKNMEVAMKKSLAKALSNFRSDEKYFGDSSTASFCILVIINSQIYYMQNGGCRSICSKNFGASITSTLIDSLLDKKSHSSKQMFRNDRLKEQDVSFQVYKATNQIDWILLGSEGVFENFKLRDLGKKLWLYLLKNKNNSVHTVMGEVNTMLLSDIFSTPSYKNASLIIIGFENIVNCFESAQERDNICLPHFK